MHHDPSFFTDEASHSARTPSFFRGDCAFPALICASFLRKRAACRALPRSEARHLPLLRSKPQAVILSTAKDLNNNTARLCKSPSFANWRVLDAAVTLIPEKKNNGRISTTRRSQRTGKKSPSRRPPAARPIPNSEMARLALRRRPGFRRSQMGLQNLWRSRRRAKIILERISRAPADRSRFRHPLRHSLEPLEQHLEGCPLHRRSEATPSKARSQIRPRPR